MLTQCCSRSSSQTIGNKDTAEVACVGERQEFFFGSSNQLGLHWRVGTAALWRSETPQNLSVTDTRAVLLWSWVTSDASRRGLPASLGMTWCTSMK